MRLLQKAALLYVATAVQVVAQPLGITIIDVEQGASALIVAPSGKTLLVDTGRNGHGSRVRAAMDRAGVNQIDHRVSTHYHEDHYGGADDLVAAPNAVTVVNVHDRGDKAFLPADKFAEATFIDYPTAPGHRAHHLMRSMSKCG